MKERTAGRAALFAALIVAACQSYLAPREPTAVDGSWGSTDGAFLAEFDRGRFNSRLARTGEVFARGTYSIASSTVSLRWRSDQKQHSATCVMTDPSTIDCLQDGVQSQWRRL